MRAAQILGEERDQHSCKVDVLLRANDPNGSGTYKVTFEPGRGPRELRQGRVQRIHE